MTERQPLAPLLAALLLWIASLPCVAKTHGSDSIRHYGFKIDVAPGRIICMDQWQKKWQRNKQSTSIGFEINHSALPSDSNAYSRDYNYPSFNYGLRLSLNDVTMHRDPDPAWGYAEEVDYDSRLGNIVTAYTTFTRPLLRTKHWTLDYLLGSGIGYGKHKYSPGNNIDNELTGSRFLIYFVAGAHATYRVTRDWGLTAGLEFFHHSNGALNRPNKGANVITPVVGIRYMPYYEETLRRPHTTAQKDTEQPRVGHWFSKITIGTGGKTLNEDWQLTQFNTPPDSARYRTSRFHFYTAYSLQADILYRYARRWASGIGADLFYGTYANHVKQLDQAAGIDLPHSPWSFGLAAKHHAYYNRLYLNMAVGVYLYRHMGQNAKEIEKPYYERIGVNYAFPKLGNLSIGFNVKAHLTKADLTEIVVSYPISH